jgi:hypothetical protein
MTTTFRAFTPPRPTSDHLFTIHSLISLKIRK